MRTTMKIPRLEIVRLGAPTVGIEVVNSLSFSYQILRIRRTVRTGRREFLFRAVADSQGDLSTAVKHCLLTG